MEEVDETPQIAAKKEKLRSWIDYFGRTDHEWVVNHLCQIYNAFVGSRTDAERSREFVREVPKVLSRAIDPDPSARISDPIHLFKQLEGKAFSKSGIDGDNMQSPFDLPSAELIRSNRQLMSLFSDEYPRLDECRSNAPVYIYGPRGCGKSTLLRSMSLPAILMSDDPASLLKEVEFIGTYVSCSTEFRSRFWLFKEEDFDVLEAHVVRYFSLLLVEGLCETFDAIYHWDKRQDSDARFGLTETVTSETVEVIRRHLSLLPSLAYHRTSPFSQLRLQIRIERDSLWRRILDRSTPSERPNSQLVFDVADALTEVCPFLESTRLAFLIDDYSNQRIPTALQQRLNQAITFAKQSNPIFKVSSEYFGVDLEGIQEGREVREVNVGSEHVRLTGDKRWAFLCGVLDARFRYKRVDAETLDVLPLSNIRPVHDMAKRIKESVKSNTRFYYHGIDTISDLCSGDFATGLDIVRKMFEAASINWMSPKEIPMVVQHRVIQEYSSREHEYIRFRTPDGSQKFNLINSLCKLSRQCVLNKTRKKEDQQVPYVKNHLDIAESALSELEKHSADLHRLFMDLVRKGVLFPLDPSRSREGHQTTRRFMMRRILLARNVTALGRDSPIRIDGLERLRTLLTEPEAFCKQELDRTGKHEHHPLFDDED